MSRVTNKKISLKYTEKDEKVIKMVHYKKSIKKIKRGSKEERRQQSRKHYLRQKSYKKYGK